MEIAEGIVIIMEITRNHCGSIIKGTDCLCEAFVGASPG